MVGKKGDDDNADCKGRPTEGRGPRAGRGSVVREGRGREEVCFPAQALFPGMGD